MTEKTSLAVFISVLIVLAIAFFSACGAGSRATSPSENSIKQSASINSGADDAAASNAVDSATETDPYIDQVREYLRTGVPVLIPKWKDKFELPYIGPILTREGVIVPEGMPVPELGIDIQVGDDIDGMNSDPNPTGDRDASKIYLAHPRPASIGSCKAIYLLVSTPSYTQERTHAAVNEKLFGENAGHTCPSITAFYDEMSYGQLDLTGGVYPEAGAYSVTSNSNLSRIVSDALNASNPDVNYASFDGDGDGYIDSITIILPYSLRAFVTYGFVSAGKLDGKSIGAVGILGYDDLAPESRTAHHEMGHFFMIPDYYDLGGDSHDPSPGMDGNESFGLGYWELMSGGNYVNPPMHMGAYNKWLMGWIEPNVITSDMDDLVIHPSNYIDNPNEVYLLWTDGIYNKEYFLIENRWLTATSETGHAPGKGLLVWHIDEDVYSDHYPYDDWGVNDNEDHKALDLEEADGLDGLDHMYSFGDSGDVYPQGDKEFSFESYPASTDYEGVDSQVRIFNIRKSTSNETITVDISVSGFMFSMNTLPPLIANGIVEIAPAVNEKVEWVELFIDGATVFASDSAPFVYSWDTTGILHDHVTVGGVGYGEGEQKENAQDLLVDNMSALYPLSETAENGFYQFFPVEAHYPSSDLMYGTRTIAIDPEVLAAEESGPAKWRQSSAYHTSGDVCFYFGGGGGIYGDNENDYLVSRRIDLSDVESPVLSFSHQYDIEENMDYARVYVTADEGETYTELAGYTGTQTDVRESLSLSEFKDQVIRVLFFFESDDSGTDNGDVIDGSGWWIDDIVVFDGPVSSIPEIRVLTPENLELVQEQMTVTVETAGEFDHVEYHIYYSDGMLKSKSSNPPYTAHVYTGDFNNQRLLLEVRAVTASGLYASDVVEVDCYNLVGDTNGDGIVDDSDVDLLRQNFGIGSSNPSFRQWFDCNGDGTVDEMDAALIGYHFGETL